MNVEGKWREDMSPTIVKTNGWWHVGLPVNDTFVFWHTCTAFWHIGGAIQKTIENPWVLARTDRQTHTQRSSPAGSAPIPGWPRFQITLRLGRGPPLFFPLHSNNPWGIWMILTKWKFTDPPTCHQRLFFPMVGGMWDDQWKPKMPQCRSLPDVFEHSGTSKWHVLSCFLTHAQNYWKT